MLRMGPPTNPPPAFCASSARISPSRMTRPTEPISTPTAAALIRRKFSGWLRYPAPTLVSATMARNLNVGGEQSGHMIFRDFTTTGDGIISALQVLRIMKESGKPLSELKRCLKKYPQAQRNLRVKRKPPLEELPAVMKLVDETEQQLSGKGRVLLRYSGTEPKIRLLIEGREPDEIDRQANRIAEAIEEAIGAG